MTETTVCKLHINIPFVAWVNKDNPHKAIMISQAEEGVIDKHIQQIFYTIKKNGADMSTAVPSIWLK